METLPLEFKLPIRTGDSVFSSIGKNITTLIVQSLLCLLSSLVYAILLSN